MTERSLDASGKDTRGSRGRRIFTAIASRWAIVFAASVGFALIAVELERTRSVWFDAPVMRVLRDVQSPPLTAFMRNVTHLGDGEVLAAVAIFGTLLLWLRGHPRSALCLAASAGGAGLLNTALKFTFARERPDVALRLADTAGFAFPSGHSMSSAAVYGAIALIALARFPRSRLPLSVACAGLVGAIGISRAYLHVHFPSDVVAGWALGLIWPVSLKPLLLGKGLSPRTASPADLRADGIDDA